MLELIENNSIGYINDKRARDWSFRYYVQNATDRLTKLHNDFGKKKFSFTLPGSSRGKNPQERWVEHQQSLDEALEAFEMMLNGTPQRSKVKAPEVVQEPDPS